MNYYSTKDKKEIVNFSTALMNGLATQKGLYMPSTIPQLAPEFIQNLAQYSIQEIAVEILLDYVQPCLSRQSLTSLVDQAFNFRIPLKALNSQQYILELFHGPTQAFKDFGARFMSRAMSLVSQQKTTILVATSGDTGGAVANGFYKVDGFDVIILFPKNKVSPYQKFQMSSLGHNIRALEVEGNFDDCQALVKQAFSDSLLKQKVRLSSANSINIGRLLPQMLYYFEIIRALNHNFEQLVVAVPSGNFGNLTAGVLAKKMGLPIHQFIAATNINDTFPEYLKSGIYMPKASKPTFSNAMDVGAPSNFERLIELYNHQFKDLCSDITADSVKDNTTLKAIKEVYDDYQYILDPHAAVAKTVLDRTLKAHQTGVVMATAHPLKFESVVQKVITKFDGVAVDNSKCQTISLPNCYSDLKDYLLS